MAAVEADSRAARAAAGGLGVVIANLNSPPPDRALGATGARRGGRRVVRRARPHRAPAAGRVRVPFPARGGRAATACRGAARRDDHAPARARVLEHDRSGPRRRSAAIVEMLAEHLIRPVEFVQRDRRDVRGRRAGVRRGRPPLGAQRPRRSDPRGPRASRGSGRTLRQLGPRVDAPRPRRAGGRGSAVRPEPMFRGRPAARAERTEAARAGARPSTAWLLDGGRAWPAGEPRPLPEPIHATHQQEPGPMTTSMNGGSLQAAPPAAGALASAHPSHSPPPAPPAPAGTPAAAAVGGDRVAEVMAAHQQVMQQFLETQRAVMLGYLGGQGSRWRRSRGPHARRRRCYRPGPRSGRRPPPPPSHPRPLRSCASRAAGGSPGGRSGGRGRRRAGRRLGSRGERAGARRRRWDADPRGDRRRACSRS